MHADCEYCVKRDICTKNVPKPCRYKYTEEERIADQASDNCGTILSAMYLPKTYQKKKEENKMKATSVQKIENVKEMHFTIEKACTDEISKVIVGVDTNDDIFEFHFSGVGCDVFADQWFNVIADKPYKMDFESERNKRKMMETENAILREKNHKLQKENEKLKKTNLHETPITDAMLVDDYNRLVEENKQNKEAAECWSKEYYNLSKKFDKLREEDEKLKQENERVKENLQSQHNMIVELNQKNCSLSAENEDLKKHITAKALEYIEINHKLQDENEELKYQLRDIQSTKEVVEQKLNTRADILDQAKKCVCGQREQDYGTPESNFQLIADLWNGYLGLCENGDGEPIFSIKSITSMDISMMMSLMKIARIKNGGGSGDSFVDLAGYAACGGEIWHEQKVKDQN